MCPGVARHWDQVEVQEKESCMPKKVVPSDVASEAAATSAETAPAEKADPVVLGVGVPLNLTLSSAKVVVSAWKDFALALKTALEEKLKKPEAAAPLPVVEAPIASA
jgi:hypothetical protein